MKYRVYREATVVETYEVEAENAAGAIEMIREGDALGELEYDKKEEVEVKFSAAVMGEER